MVATKTRKKTQLSNEHLQALANGRSEGAIIKRYLEALESHKPKRGRKRTPDSINRRLATIETQIKKADPLTRVQLTQERMNLEHELDASNDVFDLMQLEEAFIKAAKPYSARKNITYAAWREVGIDAAVLKKAGITRAS